MSTLSEQTKDLIRKVAREVVEERHDTGGPVRKLATATAAAVTLIRKQGRATGRYQDFLTSEQEAAKIVASVFPATSTRRDEVLKATTGSGSDADFRNWIERGVKAGVLEKADDSQQAAQQTRFNDRIMDEMEEPGVQYLEIGNRVTASGWAQFTTLTTKDSRD